MKEEVAPTDVEQTREMVSPQMQQNIFTPNSINNRQPRGQMNMAGKTPDMRGMRPHPGGVMQQPRMQQHDQSQGSDNDNADFIQQTNPNLNLAGKTIKKEIKRTPEGNMQYGSGEDSQGDADGQQPVYEYQYGMHHSPYQHPGYNYQMPPQPMGGQGYGMYPPYLPMMNQRPPMKQYQHPSPYSYQDRGGHMAGGMHRPPTDFYGEYKYGADNRAMPQMRGGHMESPQGFHQARPAKAQKQMPMAQQHPGYQYTNQHMSPMYQPVQHPGHYDPRSPYDYAPYKPKAGENGMTPGQQSPAFYNYKPSGMPPYSYAGGQFAKSQEQDDADVDPSMRQPFRDDQQPGGGPKGKKVAMKQRPTEDLGSKDASNPAKIGKTKQFAEDFDSSNMDN